MSNINAIVLGAAFGVFFAIGLIVLLMGMIVGGWNIRRQKKRAAEDVEAQPQPPISLENRVRSPPPSRLNTADFAAFDFATSPRVGPKPTAPPPAYLQHGHFEDIDLS
ncbi:hypothetical protein Hte_000013 [Hypoxylon texense]